MSEVKSLELRVRNEIGTGPTRALRRTGYVPVSLYGKKQSPQNMAIEERLLVKEMKEKGYLSHLFQVSVGGATKNVLIKSIQKHPVSDRPLHVDLITIDAESRVRVDITIRVLNEEKCPGLKQGGIINLLRHSLPVKCSPASIPEFIDVDVGSLKLGSSLHLADLKLPAGLEVEHPEKIETILTVAQPKVSSASEEEQSSEEAGAEQSKKSE